MALSEAKVKRLFAICREHAWSNEQLQAYLKFRYKVEKTSALTDMNYQFLCHIVSSCTPEMAMLEVK